MKTELCLVVALLLPACDSDGETKETDAPAAPTASASQKPARPNARWNPDDFDYGEHHVKVKKLFETTSKRKCAEGATLQLWDTLNTAGDHKRTVALSKAYYANCKRHPRLLSTTAYAHEQLEQWQPAADIDTELIAAEPRDMDHWWWRGRNRLKLKQPHLAAADFVQSIANQDLTESSGIAVLKLARTAKEIGQPCLGSFALRLFSRANDGEVTDSGKDLQTQLALAGNCKKVTGKGKARIRFEEGETIGKADLKIVAPDKKSKATSFLVDAKAGYTVISKSVADELGVVPNHDEAITVYAAATLMEGKVAVVDELVLGGARAKRVVVAIVDEVPGDTEGVVGLTFLWRFAFEQSAESLRLKPL